jgi:hypothetical protein
MSIHLSILIPFFHFLFFCFLSQYPMKNRVLTSLLAAAVVALAFVSFTANVSAQSKQKSPEWKEMETFHEVMAKTFHPMEEGNLKPIMARATEMATKAKQWADAKPPKEFDKANVKELLGKLVTESKALSDLVAAKGSETDVKKALSALHDRFHEISGACSTDEHKHGEHKK